MRLPQYEQRYSGPATPLWLDPANLFLLLGLCSGLVLVFLLPPYQVADEWRHFYRAWQLASGTLLGSGLGDDVPRELHRLTWETESFFGLPTREPRSWQEAEAFLREMATLRLDPAETIYVSFPTVLYAPVPYLGMTFAVGLARMLTTSPLLLMYAGRLGALALALGLTWYAIRRAPFAKWAFFVMAMTPVIAFQRAGMSADSFINGLAMLHVALVMELACVPDRKVRPADLFRLGIVTLALCLCKQAYLFLPLLHFMIAGDRFVRPGDRRIVRYWLPLLGWVAAVWWASTVMRENYEPMRAGTDAMGQLHWILGHPLQYLMVLNHDFIVHGRQYLDELIGTLGWLDLPAAQWLVLIHAAILAMVTAGDGALREWLTLFHRKWAALILAVSICFVWTLMYLWWAPVGAPALPGMQGRYFAPFLPLLSLIIAFPRRTGGEFTETGNGRGGSFLSGFWPALLGSYGLLLTLETIFRVAGHHYR
ncbi:MAG: DUF2142 domain-containing protein [Desulfobulbaceae bacterium]